MTDTSGLQVPVAAGREPAVARDRFQACYELGRRLGRPELLRYGSRFGLNEARVARPMNSLRATAACRVPLVLIGASWLFGGLAEHVARGDPITIVDVEVANWFHAHATPALSQALVMITNLGGLAAIGSVGVLLAIYLTWKRDWNSA